MVAAILVPTLDELAVEFERALSECNRAGAAAKAAPDDFAADSAAADACLVLSELCHAIARLPAQTVAHVQLKARALQWYETGYPESSGPSARLLAQLIDATLYGLPSQAGGSSDER